MTIEGLQSAASALGIPVSEIRRAKQAGCTACRLGGRFDLDGLREWFASHPPAKPPKRRVTPSTGEGLAQSLRRLERAEVEAHKRLVAAYGTEGEAQAEKSWLAVSEALRRADETLAESRRDSGEMLPRAMAEQVLERAAWCLVISAPAVARAAGYAIDPDRAGELTAALMGVGRNYLYSGVAAGAADKTLPEWAVAAIRRGASTGLEEDAADFEARRKAFRTLFRIQAEDGVARGLADVAAVVAKHEAQQAAIAARK